MFRVTPRYHFEVKHAAASRAKPRTYGFERLGHRDYIEVPLTPADKARKARVPYAPSTAAICAYNFLKRAGRNQTWKAEITPGENGTERIMFKIRGRR